MSTKSAPPHPHPNYNPRHHSPSQLLSIRNRNETGLLLAHLDNAHRDSSHSAATTAFATSAGIAHASGARTRTIAIHYFCHWDDCLSVCRDGFAVDRLHARLPKNTFLQGWKHYPTWGACAQNRVGCEKTISRQLCMPRRRVAHASSGYSLLEDREKWAPPLTLALEHRSGPPGPRKSNRFVRGPFSFCLCPLVADCHRSLIRRKIQSERSP